MKIDIEVPESIPLSKVQAFLAELGFKAKNMREFHVGLDGVYAEITALRDGRPYLSDDGTLAVHRIAIPLDREV